VSADRGEGRGPLDHDADQEFMIGAQFDVCGHAPDRASWNCKRCGTPFPCDDARSALKAGLGTIPLAMFMWAMFDAVVHDLGDAAPSAAVLFDRLLTWARVDPLTPRPASDPDLWRGHGLVVSVLHHTRQQRPPPGARPSPNPSIEEHFRPGSGDGV
jgi:hypothetical protein